MVCLWKILWKLTAAISRYKTKRTELLELIVHLRLFIRSESKEYGGVGKEDNDWVTRVQLVRYKSCRSGSWEGKEWDNSSGIYLQHLWW